MHYTPFRKAKIEQYVLEKLIIKWFSKVQV